jgi:hypothetical protein
MPRQRIATGTNGAQRRITVPTVFLSTAAACFTEYKSKADDKVVRG